MVNVILDAKNQSFKLTTIDGIDVVSVDFSVLQSRPNVLISSAAPIPLKGGRSDRQVPAGHEPGHHQQTHVRAGGLIVKARPVRRGQSDRVHPEPDQCEWVGQGAGPGLRELYAQQHGPGARQDQRRAVGAGHLRTVVYGTDKHAVQLVVGAIRPFFAFVPMYLFVAHRQGN